MEELFDKVYCINLDKRRDRWNQFSRAIKQSRWPFKEPERFSAIDGQMVPYPPHWKAGPGAWGCFRSHSSIIEKSLNQGDSSVLILEDDAIPISNFRARITSFMSSLPSDWGMVYLGGEHLRQDVKKPRRVNEEVYVPYYVARTHAYAIRGTMLRTVFRHLSSNDWRRGQHVDHRLSEIHMEYFKTPRPTKIYCPKAWLIGQAKGKSNISGERTPKQFWEGANLLEIDPFDHHFIAVVGLHSSGSSCLSGVLYNMGIQLGHTLGGYYGNVPATGDCGYEALGLERILNATCRFPSTRYSLPRFQVYQRLKEWIDSSRKSAGVNGRVAGGKHPLLCRVGDQLLNICREKLRVIFSNRPTQESIESLIRRCPNRSPKAIESHQKWLEKGKRDLFDKLPHEQKLNVDYSELIRNPVETAKKIQEFLGLNLSNQELQNSVRFVAESKRHIK